jgi:hypothetical protein
MGEGLFGFQLPGSSFSTFSAFLRRSLLEAIKLYDLWKIKDESWQRRGKRRRRRLDQW